MPKPSQPPFRGLPSGSLALCLLAAQGHPPGLHLPTPTSPFPRTARAPVYSVGTQPLGRGNRRLIHTLPSTQNDPCPPPPALGLTAEPPPLRAPGQLLCPPQALAVQSRPPGPALCGGSSQEDLCSYELLSGTQGPASDLREERGLPPSLRMHGVGGAPRSQWLPRVRHRTSLCEDGAVVETSDFRDESPHFTSLS